MKKFLSLWVPVLIWAGFIFYLSSIPHLRFFQNDLVDFVVRKIGHMGVFGILARLLARAFMESTLWSWRRIFATSLMVSFLYACTDEYHQAFVPGRHPTLSDVAFDTVGSWFALGIKP
jgi:VanZ family protein